MNTAVTQGGATANGRVRVGVDVLERGELRRLITRPWFLRFSYAPEEAARAEEMGPERRLEFLAGRFAAKEAILKVLGTGMLQGVAPREICVDRDSDGAPVVRFRGRAAQLAPPSVALSITHKQNVVAAVAIGLPHATGAGPEIAEALAPDVPSLIDSLNGTTARVPTHREEFVTMSAADTEQQTSSTTAFLRVRIGQEDAHYGGGLVDGARLLRLFGDLVTEITVRTDGDEGLLAEYSEIRFTAPVQPGDYIEASGRLVRRTRLRRVVELEAHKVIAARPGTGASAAELLAEPQLVCAATATTVVPLRRATASAPAAGTGRKAAPEDKGAATATPLAHAAATKES